MKKNYVLGLLVLLALVALPIVNAAGSLDPTLTRYEPLPAQPGQYVTVYIEIENVGTTDAPNAALMIEDQFPFTVVNKNEQMQNIGVVGSQRSKVIDIRLLVDSEAAVGNNNLRIRFTEDVNANQWQERDLTIEVKEDDTSLSISEVSTSPEKIPPGGAGTITLTVKNSESVVLRNIALQLGLYTVQGSTVTDLPFIPTNSATEKKITRLNPGEITQVSFDVKAYPSATPGFYKLPLTMTFFDEQGSETEKEDVIGVIVQAVPELKIYVEEKENLRKDTQGEITLKFVNKGINDLKFLDVEILPSDDYSIESAKEYIGDLDSDDYRSETFVLTPNKENINLQVKTTYKDENNEPYENIEMIPVICNCEKANGEKNSTATIIIVAVVVVGLLLLITRRRRRKKRRK